MSRQKDKYCWGSNKNGIYSVRSGYHFALQQLRSQRVGTSSGHSILDFHWTKLWKLPCQPKLLHFIWRLMHNSLPVRAQLIRRGINCVPLCPWCANDLETAAHLFRDCKWIKEAWMQSPLGYRFTDSSQIPVGVWVDNYLNKSTEEASSLFIALCYGFWQAMNKFIFQNQQVNLNLIFTSVVNSITTSSHLQVTSPTSQHADQSNDIRWLPPPPGCYKVNVDAAKAVGDVWRIGILIRDDQGYVLAAAARRISSLPDPGLAESMGIRLAAYFANDMCFQNVIIE
ncbi:Reverse transcriptase zinc-binding domain [Sesbania bispinosa]|nr:Reverse transcriptase zinc-binding domain [Sesbania bispinosa]